MCHIVRVPRSFIPRKNMGKTVDLSTKFATFRLEQENSLKNLEKEPNIFLLLPEEGKEDEREGPSGEKSGVDQHHVTYFTIGEEETNSFDAHLQETTFSSS